MKKIFTYIALFIATLTTLTSCDRIHDIEDRQEARTLDGTWTGYIDTYYADRWGMTGDSFRTTIHFERESAYGGWGYEVDYDYYHPYEDYYYCEFTWEVYNGTIILRYADSWNDVRIRDYVLSDDYFKGHMDDGVSTDIYFQLAYDYRFDWSYWRTRGATRRASGDSSVQASGQFSK